MDTWAVGVVTYLLLVICFAKISLTINSRLTGKLPFDGAHDAIIETKIRRLEFDTPIEQLGNVSQGAKAFIDKLLTIELKSV